MGVDSAHLAPNGAQIFGSGRHFCAKDLLQGLAIGHAVLKGANAANTLYHILIVMEVPTTGQFFQSPMDKADGGDGLNHLFVLQDQIQMYRLRQHRVLRAKGHDGAISHSLHLSPFFSRWLRSHP